MSMMLRTINPDAADAIDNPPALPDVATMVVFIPRAGVTRMHRGEFPAIVMAGNIERQTLTLLVMMEAEDMIEETNVPFQSHHQTAFCWRYPRGTAADLDRRIAKLEEYLDGDDKVVEDIVALDQRVTAVEGVLANDEIEQIEKRVAKLEKAVKKAK